MEARECATRSSFRTGCPSLAFSDIRVRGGGGNGACQQQHETRKAILEFITKAHHILTHRLGNSEHMHRASYVYVAAITLYAKSCQQVHFCNNDLIKRTEYAYAAFVAIRFRHHAASAQVMVANHDLPLCRSHEFIYIPTFNAKKIYIHISKITLCKMQTLLLLLLLLFLLLLFSFK